MGEIAEMMLDGTMDPETGEFNFDGEDGPGFPMTGAEAAEYRRATGWRGRLGAAPHEGPIFGFWRRVAEAIRDGKSGVKAIARHVHASHTDTQRAVKSMIAAGYLHRDDDVLKLTKRCRRELEAGAPQ